MHLRMQSAAPDIPAPLEPYPQQHLISYDKFHEKDNIYRVSFSGGFAEKKTDYAFAWAPLGPTLKNYFPEITDFVRLYRLPSNSVVKCEESKFLHDGLFYADQNFFDFINTTIGFQKESCFLVYNERIIFGHN